MFAEEVIYEKGARDAVGRVLHIIFLGTNFLALWNVGNVAMNLRDMDPLYTSLWLLGVTFAIGIIATIVSGFAPALTFEFNSRT
jgi:hypothetical protein